VKETGEAILPGISAKRHYGEEEKCEAKALGISESGDISGGVSRREEM
jgi:hypothetical protein